MSEKKTPETPVDKYNRLTRELKHQKKALETSKRNVEKTTKALNDLMKKLWFCPICNKPQLIPNKKEINQRLESKLNDDGTESFYKCRYAHCSICDKYVLIEKEFMGEDD